MKKLLIVFISVLLICSFVACDNEKNSSTSSIETSSQHSQNEVSSTDESSTQESSSEPDTPLSFMVVFDTNGAGNIPPQNVNENGYLIEPTEPTKHNHTFDGWYFDGVKWDFKSNNVTANITLEARWTEVHSVLEFQEYNGKYEVVGVKNKNVTDIEIPMTFNGKPVMVISARAFKDCRSLVSVSIPNSIETIGDYAFEGCSSLKSLVIPNSVIRMKNTALYQCTALESLTIGAGIVEALELGTLTSLNTIVVDENNSIYKILGNDLYSKDGTTLIVCLSAKNATSYVVSENVTKLHSQAFEHCKSLESITISKNIINIGYTTLSIPSLKNIIVDENNTVYKSIDGNLYSKDEATLVSYAPANPAKSFETPQAVTMIEEYAFFNCDNLETLVISSAVDEIPANAIVFCDNLKTIQLLNGVTKISTYAISNCGLLEKIIIPNSVTHIDAHAFLGCENAVIYCEGSAKGINWSENWNYDNNFVIWNYADE